MKAIVVRDTGGPDRLELAEVDPPTAGPGELLVDVAAAGLNFIDTYQRTGLYPMKLPFTPGLEGSGVVAVVGEGTEGFQVGDRVAWSGSLGSYAEQKSVPAASALLVPDGVDLETAAAVVLQGLTAHYLASDTFALEHGQTCLIHAGAGGVGLLLTQIAKMRGARVITTVGSDDKARLSKEAGADDVINYVETDFGAAVETLVGEKAIDVVYDGVGAATFETGLDLLRPRGMMVTFGNSSGPAPAVSPLLLMQKGSLFLTRPTIGDYTRTREELERRVGDLFTWIATGDLEVRVGARFPLAKAGAAHDALEGRETTGKVLLIP